MTETEPRAGRDAAAAAYVRIAQQAAELAVAVADEAMNAVCRSRSGNAARLEERMHATHEKAQEAERYAAWAETGQTDGTAEYVLRNYATKAVTAAIETQTAAGIEVTAHSLPGALKDLLPAAERTEREALRREMDAEMEARERAATGMDSDNRRQAHMNRYLAERHVAELGWTAGHVAVLEAAETGRLYERDDQFRQAPQAGVWQGGRRISRGRANELYGARFLAAVRPHDGTRILRLSPAGHVALKLARLHPAGLYATDRDAHEARYARVARRHKRMDDKKAAARRLPPLDHSALRLYQRPVTLAEQQTRADQEADARWEDEGGYCPGVPAPRPAAEPTGGHRELRTVIRRPQRTLTREEHQVVQKTALLNLQGALILGIVDPVANPSPMPEETGAWVRKHAWPEHFHTTERRYPWGFQRWATCERGTCWNCLAGRCDLCVHRQQGGPHVDDNTDWVHDHRGRVVAKLILRPAGEECVWWCRCPCAKTTPEPPAAPEHGAPAPAPAKQATDPRRRQPAGPSHRRTGRAEETADARQEALF